MPHGDGTFTDQRFIVRPSRIHVAPLHDIPNLFERFKSRESPGHSKAGVLLISRMCFIRAILDNCYSVFPDYE